MQDVDSVLSSFLHSSDESERDRLIEELILVHAVPIIRLILKRRLGFYVSQSGANMNNPEATDLYHDIVFKIFQRLHDLHSQSPESEIKDFSGYVNRLTSNACNDYLRIKSPARYLLKNRIRYLLIEHQDFKMWKIGKKPLCGFASWDGREDVTAEIIGEEQIVEISEAIKVRKFANETPGEIRLPLAVAEIFRWIDRPLEIETLVSLASRILEIQDAQIESLEEIDLQYANRIVDSGQSAESCLQGKERLQELWREIMRLPPIQRQIIFLSQMGEVGEDFWSLLLEADAVTVSQLASDLEISQDRFMSLWKQIPMDVAGIAKLLGLTRQQVIKMKYNARKELRSRLSGL